MVYSRNYKNIGIVVAVIVSIVGLLVVMSSLSEAEQKKEEDKTREKLDKLHPDAPTDYDKRVNLKNVDLQILAKDIHGLLNLERQKQNLPELQWDEKLSSIAGLRTADFINQYDSFGEFKNMDDPKFSERANQNCHQYPNRAVVCLSDTKHKVVTNHDYDYCGTSQGIQLAKDLVQMKIDLDSLASSIDIKSNDYDKQLKEYQLYGRDSQYDLLEKTRLEYNSLIGKQDQINIEYNAKIAIYNKMIDDGEVFDKPSEQLIPYLSEKYDARTYADLVHDMTTVNMPLKIWNATSGQMETDYSSSSLFDYLYDKEEYNSFERNTQVEGIGMYLSGDILYMSWYEC